jgi:hypothetical protein
MTNAFDAVRCFYDMLAKGDAPGALGLAEVRV